MTPSELVQDALARIVWIREDADRFEREQALAALEDDLASWLALYEERAA